MIRPPRAGQRNDDGANGEVREARARGRRPRLPAVSRRARQADLRERVEGSVGPVDQAADDARQREPPVARRSACAEVARRAYGEALLRRWRRNARRIRATEAVMGRTSAKAGVSFDRSLDETRRFHSLGPCREVGRRTTPAQRIDIAEERRIAL